MGTFGKFGCLAALLVLSSQAGAEPGVRSLLDDGTVQLDLRYRHESVHQDNALGDASADTLRTRLALKSGSWRGLSGLVEIDDVRHLFGDQFNSARNGRVDRSLVPDPRGTEVNQAWLSLSGAAGSAAVGRQRINLDNQRFVGSVGWRQNEQTLDGVLLQTKPAAKLKLTYAWIDQVNTIFGPEDGIHATAANLANLTGSSHLWNLRYEVTPHLAVLGYHYKLGLDNAAVSAAAPPGTLSSTTTGLRLSGSLGRLRYAFEHARQDEGRRNPWALDSRYRLVELGYDWPSVQLTAGHEVLGGDDRPGNRAFQTPLATKHQFQGWADVFLTTPPEGVEDTYLGVEITVGKGRLQARYHDFAPELGGGRYGRELDASVSWPLPIRGLTGLAKFARYESRDRSRTVDTDKLWLQLQYSCCSD